MCNIDIPYKICYPDFVKQKIGGFYMGRPVKKVHKSQQQRKKEAEARKAEQQKKEERLTYIMLGVVAVIFVIIAGIMLF